MVQLEGLADFQTAVLGWIEAVDVPAFGVTMYVNEEGLVRRLPVNTRATFLWWHHDPVARGKAILVGDVVVVGARVDDELGRDLGPDTVATLVGPGEWRIRARLEMDLTTGGVAPWARCRVPRHRGGSEVVRVRCLCVGRARAARSWCRGGRIDSSFRFPRCKRWRRVAVATRPRAVAGA
ncbi:DUF3846 domain-containing protein [Antiquaquibacter oligotrophicus]|nr:DUF3846 domain-containing protein [Antiquaquibacter oligotrophicus]